MVRAEIVETLKAHGVEAFPVDEARVKSILRGIDRKEAKKLASKIDYLDDWKDHSNIGYSTGRLRYQVSPIRLCQISRGY